MNKLISVLFYDNFMDTLMFIITITGILFPGLSKGMLAIAFVVYAVYRTKTVKSATGKEKLHE